MKEKKSRGFTVIELLIAVSIIVVLVALIIFLTSRSRARAEDARTQETLANVRTIAVEERLQNESGSGSGGSQSGYANVCSSESVREAMYTLAQQLGTIDYACVSSADEFAIAFPLKAQSGYWCVDANGVSGKVEGLPTASPPHQCSNVAPSDGSGGPSGEPGDGNPGDGGGDPGDGGTEEGGGDDDGINDAPVIVLEAGSFSAGGGVTQMCSGIYCVVTPASASEDAFAFVSATDSEDGALSVTVEDEAYVYTSSIPTDGPGIGQKTIAAIGVFEGCDVSSKKITYEALDNDGESDSASRTFLFCESLAQPDTTAPVVSITDPEEDEVLSGTRQINATASDNVGVVGVSFLYGISAETATTLIDAEDSASPYSVSWDTSGVTDGEYVLIASARDVAGNVTASAPIPITIQNEEVAPARKPLLFSSGFEGPTTSFLNGFSTQQCCSYSIGQSTTLSREGLASLKTEVRSTDSKVSGGWRAEVLPGGVEDEGDRWYGWSVYFQTPASGGFFNGNYGGQYVHWNSNAAGSSKLSWTWSENNWMLMTDPELPSAEHVGIGGPKKITANTWHDIVVHANWSTGLLEVWLDNALFYSAPAGSGLISEDPGQYFKFGIVRWGEGAGGAPTGTKWVVYYDSLRIGDGATGVGYYDVAPGDY